GTRQTVRVEGQQGEGPTRSEVIRSSAQRGFASRDYRDVYTDYSGHAEEVLEQDEVPPGYRSHVRRDFHLIRPRDAQREQKKRLSRWQIKRKTRPRAEGRATTPPSS